MCTWDWLADLCSKEGITFVLGYALSRKAIPGGKAKNAKMEAHKLAVLVRGGLVPQAYVYPAERRATRDLLRRRCHLARQRAELLGHIPNTRVSTISPRSATGWRTKRSGKTAPTTFLSPVSARCLRPMGLLALTTLNCGVRSNSISPAVPTQMMARRSPGGSRSPGLARFWPWSFCRRFRLLAAFPVCRILSPIVG
jgi:hypothetical protein